MKSEITLSDVRKEALKTIEQLRNKETDHKTAGEIRNLLNVIIDTAKVQIEFVKTLPPQMKEKMTQTELKQLAGAISSKDVEIDDTLAKLKQEYPISEVERPSNGRFL